MDLSAFSLAGRTALITGAGRGIGRALALGLAGAGAAVVVTDVEEGAAARGAGGAGTLGRGAGGAGPRGARAAAVGGGAPVSAGNVRGPFLLSQAGARRMAARGGGSIVNIASQLGLVGMAGPAAGHARTAPP